MEHTYNCYTQERIAAALTPSMISLYSNVYNMAVLRPDEHVRSTDCLHCMRPGPQDFWNYLPPSDLADSVELRR